MKKVFLGMCLACSLFAGSSMINTGAVTFNTSYGQVTGLSSTSTWKQPSTPTFRRVQASTRAKKAVPKIAASVKGYINGNEVLSANNTDTNAVSVVATKDSTSYVNASITGTGIHAVWSSTVKRVDHISRF